MKRTTITRYALATLLLAAGNQAQAQLLKGSLKGIKTDDTGINYSPDEYVLNARVIDLKLNPDSTFTFDMNLDGDFADVEVLLGDDMLGVHLVKGKTVQMDIVKTASGYDVKYKGAEARVSEFVNTMKRAFDGMRYWSPDPGEAKSNAEYCALLEQENKKVQALLPTLRDKEQRAYYTKLADYEYRWTRLRLMMDSYDDKKGQDYRNDPLFKSMLADIDVNDPIAYQTNLSMTKLFASVPGAQESGERYCREMMKAIDARITRPNIRRTFVKMLGQQYFMYGDGDDNSENFIKDITAWAGKDADVLEGMIQQFRDKRASQKATASGTKAPDITLTDRNGKNFRLSELINGKLTYIDVWATWCGPCKREIPFVAKMVERYKGNDKVQFISISVDENVDAWKKMIDKEQPAWAQYNVNGEVNAEFSKQWGITGIPRFIMIDKDGNIFSADATRPSDEKTVATIDEAIAR